MENKPNNEQNNDESDDIKLKLKSTKKLNLNLPKLRVTDITDA